MVDILRTCQSIISLGFSIKDMVATFSTNREYCSRILNLIDMAQAVVEPLNQTTQPNIVAMEDERMGAVLKVLEKDLQRSLEIVKTCKKKNAVLRYIGASDDARVLRRVLRDISSSVDMVSLAISVDIRSRLLGATITHQAHPPNFYLPQQVEKSWQKVPEKANYNRVCHRYPKWFPSDRLTGLTIRDDHPPRPSKERSREGRHKRMMIELSWMVQDQDDKIKGPVLF